MKKWWWTVAVVVIAGINVYKNKEVFSYKFDFAYWDKFYNESQYVIPRSKREISDEGVYQYVGYRLVEGENPFNIDYWVPPLGKYFYGLSAKVFGNPYLTSVTVYFLGWIIFGLITKTIIKDEFGRATAIILYGLNPLLLKQVGVTMLDVIVMGLLLGHLGTIFKVEKGDYRWVTLAGITLGLMAGVKVAFFLPIVALADAIYLIKKIGIKKTIYWLGGIFVGYGLAYFCYFIRHPNPLPWIRLHEKVIDYWANGGRELWGGREIWRYLTTGWFLGLKGSTKTMMWGEWSPIIGISLIGTIYYWFKSDKKNEERERMRYLAGLILGWIVIVMLIDFWPRYLVPIVPMAILFLVSVSQKQRKWQWLWLLMSLPGYWLAIQ
jgi:hypothetical protein